MKTTLNLFIFLSFLIVSCTPEKSKNEILPEIDLTRAKILFSPGIKSDFSSTLLKVITEEVEKRSSVKWKSTEKWVNNPPTIAFALSEEKFLKGVEIPHNEELKSPENLPEGYRVFAEKGKGRTTIWIIGADQRGLLYGTGQLLRKLNFSEKQITLTGKTDIASSPVYPIRGHQLGYRNTANSWDAWTVQQYDQYIRELALFGSNSIEDIPFQSDTQSVHMIMPHKKMHIKISEICEKYDMDYWVWTPATGDLSDEKVRKKELKQHEDFYKSIPRLDAIFFPGGDPGDNHPMYVLPHLRELSRLLKKYHPGADVWISLQGFDREKIEYFIGYLIKYSPDWLKGVVYGPGSPTVNLERKVLPKKYLHRLYGDITHTVRCQYPVENWDQAFALTLGREPTNPQPYYYAKILRADIPFTNGFLSYSDGINDDVNKIVWNQVGWDPSRDVRDIVVDYCKLFLGGDVAQNAADGILALERNWVGPLIQNGAVEGTLALWQSLESSHPELSGNWRWQQLLMRAYYDAYTRRRLIYEQNLETEANRILEKAKKMGADKSMAKALETVTKADSFPVEPELKNKIELYCDALYKSIGLQTSVPKYQARGYERGCVLDFVNYPLNNRWWLEDEFVKVRKMKTEKEKLKRLEVIRTWSHPGQGNYYDNISSASEGLHVISHTDDAIDYAWWDNGFSRRRLSTQLFQFTPVLKYERLNEESDYLIRVSGYGEALLRANGVRLKPVLYNKELETFKEFILPKEIIKNGNLEISFDAPDEAQLNWRKYSKVTDVWLLKINKPIN